MPTKASKIAISLPADLLAEADRLCRARGESRSEFIRAAMTAFLREARRRADVERYVKSYTEDPGPEPDARGLLSLGLDVLAGDCWE